MPKECVEDYNKVRVFDVLPSNKKINGVEREWKDRGMSQEEVETDGFTFKLTVTACNLWGVRPWFLCPRCNRRIGTLFFKEDMDAVCCRHCLNLTYRERQEKSSIPSQSIKISKKISKINEKLQKKGLWYSTIYKLVNEKARLQQKFIYYLKLEKDIISKKLEKDRDMLLRNKEIVESL